MLTIVVLWAFRDTSIAISQTRVCDEPFYSVSLPLNDLGSGEYIRMDGAETGFLGGLYPNSSNTRPQAHNGAGIAISQEIVPLGTDGQPIPDGRVVMISVGMSNAAQEFRDFVELAKNDLELNPLLALVNGAQPGAVTNDWIDPDADTWDEIDRRLNSGGLSPNQVQIAWVKNTQTGSGDFPQKIQSIQTDLEQIARNFKNPLPKYQIGLFFQPHTLIYLLGGFES